MVPHLGPHPAALHVQSLYSSCEVLRQAARRFGAVWLVRAASHLAYLLSVSRVRGEVDRLSERLEKDRLAALMRCEEEVAVIGDVAQQLRHHIESRPDTSLRDHFDTRQRSSADETMPDEPRAASGGASAGPAACDADETTFCAASSRATTLS